MHLNIWELISFNGIRFILSRQIRLINFYYQHVGDITVQAENFLFERDFFKVNEDAIYIYVSILELFSKFYKC